MTSIKIITAFALSLALTGMSAEKEFDKETARYRKTGGVITVPGTGAVRIVNGQVKLKDDRIQAAIKIFQTTAKVTVKVESGSFDFNAANKGTLPTVYIVDSDVYPLSLYAPESRYSVLNVRNLNEERGQKALVRSIWIASGALLAHSRKNPLDPITEPADLDAIVTDSLIFDNYVNMIDNLGKAGVTQERVITYRMACQQGCAPAPTNDIQKAIWEKIHSIPTKPIKIEFDPKTDK